jgi:DNA primase
LSDSELVSQIKSLGVSVVDVKGREVACLCPVHTDRSPSFFFNLDSQKFNCFVGCLRGKGIHQLAFQLNKKLDVEAPTPLGHQDRIVKANRTPTIPVLPLAIDNKGEKYLNSRKITRESIETWNIQYYEEKDAIVIPIEDVGYIMRFLGPSAKKYLTIPGTKIGSTLFGLSRFNPLYGSAILVEGSLDCIWMHQLGFDHTLGILHADLTLKQYKLLQGITTKIYIALDGDQPGQVAAEKLRNRLKSNFIVRRVILPEGKDPDNLNKSELLRLLDESH